jgi:hypothetical protein
MPERKEGGGGEREEGKKGKGRRRAGRKGIKRGVRYQDAGAVSDAPHSASGSKRLSSAWKPAKDRRKARAKYGVTTAPFG